MLKPGHVRDVDGTCTFLRGEGGQTKTVTTAPGTPCNATAAPRRGWTFTAAYGYRAELKGQRDRLIRLGMGSLIGSIIGGLLLLWLDPDVFQVVVPVLIGLACVLVVSLGPRLSRLMTSNEA